jgi:hypothetical protein
MPFKSEKQRRWMHANKPKMAREWEKHADGGEIPSDDMLKNAIARNTTLQKFSHMRAGGMIGNGSLTPKYKDGGLVENFQDQICRKASKGS